jgi:hypothetical protein
MAVPKAALVMPQGDQQSRDDLEQVVVTGTRETSSVAQMENLPLGIEIIIGGQRMCAGDTLSSHPEQPVPPVPRSPVQSPVNITSGSTRLAMVANATIVLQEAV